MKSMRLHEIGAALTLEEAPIPEPGPQQILVRVRACGVNFADTLMVTGRYQEKPDLPFAPGLEVAGVVEALGEGVASPRLGTRVAVTCGHGGFAEYVLAPAAAAVPVPDQMNDAEAAALQVA
ncbi:MAG: alcohol dehydrogenase catalytic domain-containing protein, partial [Pseudomonadota bacterium]